MGQPALWAIAQVLFESSVEHKFYKTGQHAEAKLSFRYSESYVQRASNVDKSPQMEYGMTPLWACSYRQEECWLSRLCLQVLDLANINAKALLSHQHLHLEELQLVPVTEYGCIVTRWLRAIGSSTPALLLHG